MLESPDVTYCFFNGSKLDGIILVLFAADAINGLNLSPNGLRVHATSNNSSVIQEFHATDPQHGQPVDNNNHAGHEDLQLASGLQNGMVAPMTDEQQYQRSDLTQSVMEHHHSVLLEQGYDSMFVESMVSTYDGS